LLDHPLNVAPIDELLAQIKSPLYKISLRPLKNLSYLSTARVSGQRGFVTPFSSCVIIFEIPLSGEIFSLTVSKK
jgi:hypothetical protein